MSQRRTFLGVTIFLVTGDHRGSRVKSNNERDKTLNKLMERTPAVSDSDVLKEENENMSWSALKLPISR